MLQKVKTKKKVSETALDLERDLELDLDLDLGTAWITVLHCAFNSLSLMPALLFRLSEKGRQDIQILRYGLKAHKQEKKQNFCFKRFM